MEEKLSIALVAAAVSIVVAITSAIVTLISNRKSVRANRELEKLKNQIKESSEARKIADGLFSESVESIRTAIKALQIMKDEILLILNSTSDSLDPGEARARLVGAREKLFEVYQDHHANLNLQEDKALHRAKNQVVDIEKYLDGENFRDDLSAKRAFLNESHDLLRDSLTARILDRTLGI